MADIIEDMGMPWTTQHVISKPLSTKKPAGGTECRPSRKWRVAPHKDSSQNEGDSAATAGSHQPGRERAKKKEARLQLALSDVKELGYGSPDPSDVAFPHEHTAKPWLHRAQRTTSGGWHQEAVNTARVNGDDGGARRLLFDAAASGNDRVLEFLPLEYPDLDINSLNAEGQTGLMIACERGHGQLAGVLLRLGASIKVPEALLGRSAFHSAAIGGHIYTLKLLIEHSRNFMDRKELTEELECLDESGLSPLFLASENKKTGKEAFLYLWRQRKREEMPRITQRPPPTPQSLLSNQCRDWASSPGSSPPKITSAQLPFDPQPRQPKPRPHAPQTIPQAARFQKSADSSPSKSSPQEGASIDPARLLARLAESKQSPDAGWGEFRQSSQPRLAESKQPPQSGLAESKRPPQPGLAESKQPPAAESKQSLHSRLAESKQPPQSGLAESKQHPRSRSAEAKRALQSGRQAKDKEKGKRLGVGHPKKQLQDPPQNDSLFPPNLPLNLSRTFPRQALAPLPRSITDVGLRSTKQQLFPNVGTHETSAATETWGNPEELLAGWRSGSHGAGSDRLVEAGRATGLDASRRRPAPDGVEQLIRAAATGRTYNIRMIAFNVEVNQMDSFGKTALMVASENGHVESVEALLALGGTISVSGSKLNRSALHWAAAEGQVSCVRHLMESMPLEEQVQEVNRIDDEGKTPLCLAAEAGKKGCAAFVYLVKQGGDYRAVIPSILLELPPERCRLPELMSGPARVSSRRKAFLSSTIN